MIRFPLYRLISLVTWDNSRECYSACNLKLDNKLMIYRKICLELELMAQISTAYSGHQEGMRLKLLSCRHPGEPFMTKSILEVCHCSCL